MSLCPKSDKSMATRTMAAGTHKMKPFKMNNPTELWRVFPPTTAAERHQFIPVPFQKHSPHSFMHCAAVYVCVFDEMKAQSWLAAQRDRTQSRALGVCAVLTVSIHASSSERVWKCALTHFRIVLCWVCALNRGSSQFLQKPVYSLSGLLSVQIGWKRTLSVASSPLAFMPGIDESLTSLPPELLNLFTLYIC